MTGTTPNLGLPYPEGTDPVADGDNTIQALAEALDGLVPFLQYGTINITGSGAWNYNKTLTFPTPFSTAVLVFTSLNSAAYGWISGASAVTETNCRIWIARTDQSPGTANADVSWLAIGGRPS